MRLDGHRARQSLIGLSNSFTINGKTARTRVYKKHFKMVKGCRIDTGSCKKPLSKKDSPKTLGTRLS